MDFTKYYKDHKQEIESKYTNDGSVCFDKVKDEDTSKWGIKEEIENQRLCDAIDENKNDNIVVLEQEKRFEEENAIELLQYIGVPMLPDGTFLGIGED